MNGKQLKNSILQWAIQGKLVPQDPNDEPASVLLERIRAEKARLVKEKKIKKDKNESIIYRGEDNSYYEKLLATGEIKCIDDEIPFEIPQSWCWTRMGAIGDWGSGSTPQRGNTSYYGGDILWLKTGELNNGVVYDTSEKITSKALRECSLRLNKVGDVLIAMYGATIGKVAIAGKEMTTNQACCGCTPILVYNYYLFYCLMASRIDFIKKGEGGAQPNISRDKLINHLIPLPPIAEQHRIVDGINLVLPYIDKYEKSQEALDKLNAEIFDKLKKSVLQEAIQGKLVPQDSNDEPVSVLLERIKEEKAKLFKEGKLKKKDLVNSVIFKGEDNKYFEKIDKIEKDITDEIPFEIPVEWNWCRLGCIASIKGGKRIPVGEKLTTENTGHVYIRVADMKQNSVTDNDIHYVSEAIFQKIKAYTISSDDLYITVAGTIGNVGEIPSTFNNANLTENANKIVFKFISKKFLMYCLLSDFVQSQIKSCTTKVGQPKLAIIRIENLLIPLPPLKEQYRIVAKIEQLASIMRG